jgi:hypothetical protein
VSPLFSPLLVFKYLFSKSLWTALFVSFGGPFVVAASFKLLQDSLAFLQPQLLRLFLSFISAYQSARQSDTSTKPGPSPLEGFSIATAMFVTAIIQSIILHQVSVPPNILPLLCVDIFGSISNVAMRLVCGFARVLSRLFIKRPSCCRTTSAEKHQEILSILCRLMLPGCRTCARMVSWLSRHHSR